MFSKTHRVVTALVVSMSVATMGFAADNTANVQIKSVDVSDSTSTVTYEFVLTDDDVKKQTPIEILINPANAPASLTGSMQVNLAGKTADPSTFSINVNAPDKKPISVQFKSTVSGTYDIGFHEIGIWTALMANSTRYTVRDNELYPFVGIKNCTQYPWPRDSTAVSINLGPDQIKGKFAATMDLSPNDLAFVSCTAKNSQLTQPIVYFVSNQDFDPLDDAGDNNQQTVKSSVQITLTVKDWPANYPGQIDFFDSNNNVLGSKLFDKFDTTTWNTFLTGPTYLIAAKSGPQVTAALKVVYTESDVPEPANLQAIGWTKTETWNLSVQAAAPVISFVNGANAQPVPIQTQPTITFVTPQQQDLAIPLTKDSAANIQKQVDAINALHKKLPAIPTPLDKIATELNHLKNLIAAVDTQYSLISPSTVVAGAPINVPDDATRKKMDQLKVYRAGLTSNFNQSISLVRQSVNVLP